MTLTWRAQLAGSLKVPGKIHDEGSWCNIAGKMQENENKNKKKGEEDLRTMKIK